MNSSERSTLKDVAALSGFSIKTVSRALAGETGVNKKTLAIIKKAAEKLDYRPNKAAQQLRSGVSTHAMALLIGRLHNPFYSSVAAGVESILQPAGFDLFISSTDEDPKIEQHLIANFIERDVEGLLIIPTSSDHFYLDRERQRGLPIVFLDRPPINLLADSVLIDNRKAARIATQHLMKQGHTKIAVLADSPSVWTAGERVEGFHSTMADSQIIVDVNLVFKDISNVDLAKSAINKILKMPTQEKPTAILALNNLITIWVLQALKNSSQSFEIVGFDDFDLAEILNVSVISQNAFEMGRRAAELALERRKNPNQAPNHALLEAKLISRKIGQ